MPAGRSGAVGRGLVLHELSAGEGDLRIGQHGRNGGNNGTCSGGIREDLGIDNTQIPGVPIFETYGRALRAILVLRS
jgi:hypothetical protein